MSLIKCIGCYDLHREERLMTGKRLIVYTCPRFPYDCVIGGLLRPGQGTLKAVTDCPQRIDEHCILCGNTKFSSYGQLIVFICGEHDKAWGQWLKEHPERDDYLTPKGRLRQANWVEVFREFIEDMRVKAEKVK
jgi:hypothetical protein